jgi:hypothetical protein
MITVKRGDVVQVRGERDLILVTDAADQDPDAYRTYSFILGRDETGQVFEQEWATAFTLSCWKTPTSVRKGTSRRHSLAICLR